MVTKPSFLFGDNRPDLKKDESLPDIFRSTCTSFPDQVALIFKEKNLLTENSIHGATFLL